MRRGRLQVRSLRSGMRGRLGHEMGQIGDRGGVPKGQLGSVRSEEDGDMVGVRGQAGSL